MDAAIIFLLLAQAHFGHSATINFELRTDSLKDKCELYVSNPIQTCSLLGHLFDSEPYGTVSVI